MATQKKVFKEKQTFKVPSNLHKYIIGDGGANIKEIEREANVKLTVQQLQESIEIAGDSLSNIQHGFNSMLLVLKRYYWCYDHKKNIFYEDSEIQQIFKQLNETVDREAKARGDCFSKASKAFEAGKKAEAKQLSDQGKVHQENMEKYRREASRKIVNHVNKGNGLGTLDLHGLFVSDAMDFVKERVAEAKQKGLKEIAIIPGAGNHSDDNKAKIKPTVVAYLQQNKLPFTQVNSGTFKVQLG